MNRPLSAVAALPIAIDPSIAPPPGPSGSSSDDAFLRAMFACSEETGKLDLYERLRERVVAEGGTLPPAKRRGVGAEVLGLVNALVATIPEGVGQQGPVLCCQGLTAWAMAVIDSMQRSSVKQLQAHLQAQGVENTSLAPFEQRAAHEQEMLLTVAQQYQLGIVTSPAVLLDVIMDITGLKPSEDDQKGVNKCVDLKHALLLIIGYETRNDSCFLYHNLTSYRISPSL